MPHLKFLYAIVFFNALVWPSIWNLKLLVLLIQYNTEMMNVKVAALVVNVISEILLLLYLNIKIIFRCLDAYKFYGLVKSKSSSV